MLYPNKISAKKSKKLIKMMIVISLVISIMLTLINKIINPNIHWAALSISGIVYIWITFLYAMKKNTNIASYVLIQAIVVSIFTIYIDYTIGYKMWSLNLAIPIIIITANVSMTILTIISHKKYIRYVIYQLLIFILSFIPIIILLSYNWLYNKTLTYIALGISLINLIISIILCKNDIKEALKMKFHM